MDRKFRAIKELFKQNADVQFGSVNYNDASFLIIYQKDMTDYEMLEKFYIGRLEELLARGIENLTEANLIGTEEISITDAQSITSKVFSGFLLVYSTNLHRIYAINNAKVPNRNPELRSNDIAISGSRDGFIENVDINISLIRKRIPNERLKYLIYEIGSVTKTRVALLYMEGLADETIIENVKQRLSNVRVDNVYNVSFFQSLITQSKQLIPLMTYTIRSDYCSESLLTGRFVLFMSGSPMATIAPVTFSFFLDYSDSSNESFWVGIIHRFLLSIALIVGLFLSGLAASILAHDVEFMPFLMLTNYFNARKGVSMSIVLEMIIGDGIFQLFRIAGSRPLSGINQVLLLMGSVIIGQITVTAGVISQEVMLISSISMIATYTISNNFSLNTSLNYLRMIIFFSGLIFGFIGFVIASLIVIIYLVNLESFGVPLMSPFAPFSFTGLKKALFSKAYLKEQYFKADAFKHKKKVKK